MFAGFRPWTMLAILMFIGTAMLSQRQSKFFNNLQSDYFSTSSYSASSIDGWTPSEDEWAPLESQVEEYKLYPSEDQLLVDQSDSLDGAPDGVESDDDDVGEMTAFREPKDGTIKSISLLGERNSGTRWIYG